jgi:hypothetical protein
VKALLVLRHEAANVLERKVGFTFQMAYNVLQLKEVDGFFTRCFCGEGFFFLHKSIGGAKSANFF